MWIATKIQKCNEYFGVSVDGDMLELTYSVRNETTWADFITAWPAVMHARIREIRGVVVFGYPPPWLPRKRKPLVNQRFTSGLM